MSYIACPPPCAAAPLARARRLFERFHCFGPEAVQHTPCPRLVPPVLVRLGELRGIIYRSDRGQCGRPRTFIHLFDTPPLLTCDPTGRRLHIVGGHYHVTRRGIEG